jgi:hypothetical protein
MFSFQRSAKCCLLLALVLLAGPLLSTDVAAQVRQLFSPEWVERCKGWIDRKAYPVDYIEKKTGKRQPGFAIDWKGNVKPEDAVVGDVIIVLLRTEDGRPTGYVGYIEKIEPAAKGSGVFLVVSTVGQHSRSWLG